jgi:hypothetical protein
MARTGSRFRVPATGTLNAAHVNDAFAAVDREIRGKPYAIADLPTDGSLLMTVCSDESGGATLVFFDGTDWRRVQDRAVVS